ncbi:MAG: hypothetical protein MRK01_02565 [Candidatus Scalindua sp.]|nr:hypothetical protein [Candidatus Scalindua sp.]
MKDSKRENVLVNSNISKQDVMETVKGLGINMTAPHTGALWTSFSRNYYKLQSQMNINKRDGNSSTLSTIFKKSILSPSSKEEKLCGVSD